MAIQITARVRLRDLGCEGDPPKKVTESRLELHDRIRGIVSEGSDRDLFLKNPDLLSPILHRISSSIPLPTLSADDFFSLLWAS
jgi:hypothetical protein